MSIIEGARQALITSKCDCKDIAPNLEHGESFTCSKCGCRWHSRYRGFPPTMHLKESE